MRRIGLTGGIGSGKSAAAESLRARGFPVLDADVIARDVVAPGSPGLEAVVARFGPDVRREDGTLNRIALGTLVFGDPALRQELESLLHPLIAAETSARMAALEGDGATVVFHDAALLFEAGAEGRVDEVIVLVVPEEVQVARTMARDGCTEVEVRQRMGAQMSSEDKAARADHVLDNSGDLDALEVRINELLETLGLSFESAP
jgi:dephospho-CoA kinase